MKMIKISKLKLNKDNPRSIQPNKLEKLKQSIKDFEKMLELRPIIIDEKFIVLGGNMRLYALKELGYKEIPETWVKQEKNLTEEQKQEFIIKDNIGFGEWDFEILSDKFDYDLLDEWGFDSFDTSNMDSKLDEDEDDNPYTKNIEAPIYEPTDEKPNENELYDTKKYDELINEINNAKISKKEKDFLKICAGRHIIFDYSKIANYYANSPKEIQELMENSALVIIDFNNAIEKGYVKLQHNIEMEYEKEQENE